MRSQITGLKWTHLVENLYRFVCVWQCECVLVWVTHHISANTEAGSPDWRKNFLACSPAQGNTELQNKTAEVQSRTKQNNELKEGRGQQKPSVCVAVCVCVPETKPMAGERVSNFWSCLLLSSGEIAHRLMPPAQQTQSGIRTILKS